MSTDLIFNTPPLQRLRWLCGMGGASILLIVIVRLTVDNFPGDPYYALEIIGSATYLGFAFFGNRFSFAEKYPYACCYLASLPSQYHFLELCYLRNIDIPTLMAFTIIMLSGTVMMKARFWRRFTIISFCGAVIVMVWMVEAPTIPPATLTVMYLSTGALTYLLTTSMYNAQHSSSSAIQLLEESQSFASIGGWDMDFATQEFVWTQSGADILGYTLDEVQELTLDQLVGEPSEERPLREAIEQLFIHGKPYDIVSKMRTKSDGDIWVRAKARIFTKNGKPVRAMGVFSNISEQIQREQELKQAIENAEQAALIRSQFIANMSHEIRTPLNGVIGVASLLSQMELDEETKRFVSMISTSGESLLHIINDILDFSKLEAGKMALEQRPFDLEPMLEAAADIIRPAIIEKGLALHTHYPPQPAYQYLGDENRIRQVLLNLLSNASKFTSEGSLTLRVEANELADARSQLTFTVIDTGIGIAPDAQAGLFNAFTQEDASTTRKFGGTGLGLTICSQLVSQMGGELKVKSEKGHGAEFTFSIHLDHSFNPLAESRASEQHGLKETEWASEATSDLAILLAEDNVVNQKVACMMLNKLGYRADIANDGQEAVDAALTKDYDLILMDLQMPGMDGIEATQLIRADANLTQPYIIAITANAMNEDRDRCIEAGMDDFVAKPMRLEHLKAALENHQQLLH